MVTPRRSKPIGACTGGLDYATVALLRPGRYAVVLSETPFDETFYFFVCACSSSPCCSLRQLLTRRPFDYKSSFACFLYVVGQCSTRMTHMSANGDTRFVEELTPAIRAFMRVSCHKSLEFHEEPRYTYTRFRRKLSTH